MHEKSEKFGYKNTNNLCNYCGKDFATRQSFKLHIEIVHKRLRYKCELCIKEFATKSYLKTHVKVIHEKGP